MISLNNSSSMVEEAKKAKRKFNPFVNMLISILLIIAAEIITFIPIMTLSFLAAFITNGNSRVFTSDTSIYIISLFSTVSLIIICILYAKWVEVRALPSIGITKKRFIINYSKGLLIGFLMLSALVAILVISGQLTFYSISFAQLPLIFLFSLGYIIQGASEEFLCRGVLMTAISARNGVPLGILLNSLLFGLLHFFNPGFNILSFVNIVLVGIFFSLYAYVNDNIIGVCAIHSMWNFAQGNIYGISVSGNALTPSLLKVGSFKKSLLSGGSFGAEGGLICTVVLIIAISLIVFMPKKTT